jgi:MoaA/NifB/PqqE/SkfB family radical SAM enzyme
MLLTNGLLVRKQIDEIASSVDDLIVSLDGGTAETYHRIRGVDAFDLVVDGIRAARSAGVHVSTRTTVQNMNFREIPGIIRASIDADVNVISFLPVDMSSSVAFGDRDLLQTPGALSRPEVDELDQVLQQIAAEFADEFRSGRIAESPLKLRRILSQYFRATLGELPYPRPRCNAPHFSTVIDVDGTLRPCYFLPAYGKLTPDGDRLPAAINWNAAQDLRRAYRTGERSECERCVCPLYKGPRGLMRM